MPPVHARLQVRKGDDGGRVDSHALTVDFEILTRLEHSVVHIHDRPRPLLLGEGRDGSPLSSSEVTASLLLGA